MDYFYILSLLFLQLPKLLTIKVMGILYGILILYFNSIVILKLHFKELFLSRNMLKLFLTTFAR